MSNSLPTGTGFTGSQYSPEYVDLGSKDKLQQITDTTLKQGSPVNPGVILTKDGLDVPLEVQFGINDEKINSGRPTLLPLFRTRYVDDRTTEDNTQGYYQELRGQLSPTLQNLLAENELKSLEERDPDLVALDMSLRFEANWLAISNGLSVPSSSSESALIGAQQFLNMPSMVRSQMLDYGNKVSQFLDTYLATLRRDDPSFDILLNVSNQIKEAILILNTSP
jgi:hypothetical protein